ncbi:MAG: carbohydrate binding domain-containing protein [Oscillospiraceae bacterium]|nr:carbohydrate binding domain-containing protein [Oscillospiraceae bacterium]
MFFKKKKKETQTVQIQEQENEFVSFEYDESRVLYQNNFEDELNGWIDRGPGKDHYDQSKYSITVETTAEEKHSGTKCMKISGRQFGWNGATINIIDFLRTDTLKYEAMVWVKIPDNAKPCRVHLSLETNEKMSSGDIFPHFGQWNDYCDYRNILSKYRLPLNAPADESAEPWETDYPKGYTTEDGWILLRGKAEIDKRLYTSVFTYIETNGDGDANTSDIYVDDFVLLIGE